MSKNVLKTYTLERKVHVKKVIRLAMAAGLITSPKSKISSFMSQLFLFFISRLPLVKGFLRGFQFRPNNGIKEGFLIRNNPRKKSFVGRQFPSVWLKEAYSFKKVRSDDLMKGQFCLFCLDLDPQITFSQNALKKWKEWGGKVVTVKSLKDCKRKGRLNKNNPCDLSKKPHWVDEVGKLNDFVGGSSNLFIVRPDFIIFNSGRARDPGGGDSLIKESLSFFENK